MQSEQKTNFELSINQKRFWFLNKDNFEELYTKLSIRFTSRTGTDTLLAALKHIYATHEVLSSALIQDDSSVFPFQTPNYHSELSVEILESHLYQNWITKNENPVTNENRETAKPIQFFIFSDEQGNVSELVLVAHSFWVDLFGCFKIVDNIRALIAGKAIVSQENEEFIIHKNFAAWQNELVEEENNEGIEFWLNYPFDLKKKIIPFGNKPTPSFRPKKVNLLALSGEDYTRFMKSAQMNEAVVNFQFLVSFITFLRTFERSNFTIGYTLFERIYEELNETVGLVSKVVPLEVSEDFNDKNGESVESLIELIEQIKDWSDYYGADAQDLNPDRQKYEACFQYVDLNRTSQQNDHCIIENVFSTQESFQIQLSVLNFGDKLVIDFYYDQNIYNDLEISIFKDQLLDTLQETFDSDYFPQLNSTVISGILEQLSVANTQSIDLDHHSILDLIYQHVQVQPNVVAIQNNLSQISYNDFWIKTNALANYLIDKYGVLSGKSIAILLDNSVDYITSIVGILKAGAFFVPLDPATPFPRINSILSDCKSLALITEEKYESFIDFKGDVLRYESLSLTNFETDNNPPISEEIAYAIYTSGSTGKPKGVKVGHRSLLNYITWASTYYLDDNEYGNSGLFTSFSFDLTLTSLFVPLCQGKTIFVPEEGAPIVEKLVQILKNPTINIVKLTPSHINLLAPLKLQISGHKIFICGGESLTMQQVNVLFNLGSDIKVFNEYGPTEATVGCIVKEIKRNDEKIGIGRPINNTSIKIIGANGKSTIGSIGEILIGGECLALGYLNNQEETDKYFCKLEENDDTLYYKSGDLGRIMPNGELEYIGRTDDQVKVRGYRVELTEIDFQLKNHNAVSDSAVIFQQDAGQGELIAFVVTKSSINTSELIAWLKMSLPDYMIPHQFLMIAEIPLTVNGKLDKKALLRMHSAGLLSGVDYEAPNTEEEKLLVTVWTDVLKRDKIGINDSFYNLGGDSIKSIQVVARLRQYGYTFRVEDILRTPVLGELALLMKKTTRVIDQLPVSGLVELTPIQHWFFNADEIKAHQHFNQSVLLKSKGLIDQINLENSLKALTIHHDALRMTYAQSNGAWLQTNLDLNSNSFEICFHDLIDVANPAEKMAEVGESLQASFDLVNGPLLKVAHFRMQDGDCIGIIIHHLIVDGVSWRIILEDLSSLYSSFTADSKPNLALKTDSFQVWAAAQVEYARSETINQEHHYWNEIGKQQVNPLPKDKEVNGLIDSGRAFTLDKSTTEALQTKVHKVYGTEINDLLLAGLSLAIEEVLGVDKAILKMEGHGRENLNNEIDVSRTIGWFTSFYPFVLDGSLSSDPIQRLICIKEDLRKIPNKGIGYGMLKYLNQKGLENNIVPSITFNYLGDFGTNVSNDSDSLFEYLSGNFGTNISKENGNSATLDISGILVHGELSMSIRYASASYHATTIDLFTQAFKNNLTAIIESLTSENTTYLTPSDLSFKGLSLVELSDLNSDNSLEDVYELSPLQEGMYYHWLSDKGGLHYFEQMAYRIKAKELEIEKIKTAYDGLVARHAVLRTSFTNRYADRSLQIVRKHVKSNFMYEKIKNTETLAENTHDAINAYIENFKQTDREQGFDLSSPSQMRLHILELADGEYEFIWSHHHILMDGWCMGVLINDFNELLSASNMGHTLALSPAIPYSKYINWLNSVDKEASLNYWKDYLTDYNKVVEVPFKVKTKDNTYVKSRNFLKVESELCGQVDALCNRIGITQNTFIQGVWGYLLSKYNTTNDVVFGAVVSGRPPELHGVEDMIGLFINTIPVRVKYDNEVTVEELLKTIQEQSIQGTAHHYINLSEVQAQCDLGVNLINHIMIFENYAVKELENEGLLNTNRKEGLFVESKKIFEQTNYDFSITVAPSTNVIYMSFDYNVNRYDKEAIKRLTLHFKKLIELFVSKSNESINSFEYLPEEEKNQLLKIFNSTKADFSQKTVVDLFEDQADKTPDKIALEFDREKLTYKELNERANILANFLKKKFTINPSKLLVEATQNKVDEFVHTRIGVMLERSMESIIAMIGVMKTGACYVPVEHNYPTERVHYIVEDANLKLIITQPEFLEKHGLTLESIVDLKNLDLENGDTDNPKSVVDMDDGSFVIYTSGSTGKPKGVLQTHRMLTNLIQWDNNYSGIKKGLKHLQYASFSFDASLHDVYYSLSSGGSLYIVKEASRLNYLALKEEIIKSKIEVLSLPFSALSAFSQEIDFNKIEDHSIKHIISTGEQLYVSNSLVQFLENNPEIDLHNYYGPSETHVITAHVMSQPLNNIESRALIGRPISNSTVYVLDEQLKLVPQGVLGELYLGGENLAIGYLNNEEITKEKFVPSPFSDDEVLYKSGDIGRWLPDGTIEYAGRVDDQIKIRGFRVELGEIEYALAKNEMIEAAIAVVQVTNNYEKEIVAYFVAKEKLNSSDLRDYLKQSLPEYMLPTYYVQMDEFPQTRNGKIDKAALPNPEGLGLTSGIQYEPPRNEVEEKLVRIWEKVLQREGIGIKDDFFLLGGHSLKAMKLLMEYNKTFNVQLTLQDIFTESQLYLHAELFDIQNWISEKPKSELESKHELENFKF